MFKKKTLVIVMLAIAIILMASIVELISAKENEYYRKQEKLMRIAAINYFENNPYYLPNENDETTEGVLSSLVNEKYIEKIVDINNNECDFTRSKVIVKKKSKNTYIYSSYLVCPKYQTKK